MKRRDEYRHDFEILQCIYNNLRGDYETLQEWHSDLKREHAELTRLIPYARHHNGCSWLTSQPTTMCTCGYSAALRAAEHP